MIASLSDHPFEWALIALSLGATGSNLLRGDATRTVYFAAAAVLNIAVTIPPMRFPWIH